MSNFYYLFKKSHFYRGTFVDLQHKYQGMKVYTCKTLDKILELQASTYRYNSELFDIYDENGRVDIINDEIEKMKELNTVREDIISVMYFLLDHKDQEPNGSDSTSTHEDAIEEQIEKLNHALELISRQ